ncbi:MAG: hypothetical protein JWM41_1390 [Gemmatimonadetes bacterium]|nr:hypothetical protein [Gemmatimonadota bacterium]
MTDVAITSTDLENAAAGEFLGRQIAEQISGSADAVVVFASPGNDYPALLTALKKACNPKLIVGCSSAGEFTSETSGAGLTCAFALRSPDMHFSATIGRDLAKHRDAAVRTIVSGFKGTASPEFRYRSALILVDALAGYTEDLIDKMTMATAGTYRFFGGGAGDNAAFQKTLVFHGTEAYTDAAVALEILSNKPIGIGARHGWQPAGDALRVTESADACVLSFNVAPAVEAFDEHAESTNQVFDHAAPIPFFLHNIVGVDTDSGYKLRVPIGVTEQGGIVVAADVPAGSAAHIMSTGARSAADAAAAAARDALDQVEREGFQPKAALFFDCVATRLRLGAEFTEELRALGTELGSVPFAGFNSHGQIVRAEGQFSGFHNCTAVVCVFPD